MLVKRTFLETSGRRVCWGGVGGWGGGHVNVLWHAYIRCCYAADFSCFVATLHVATLQISLVSLLRYIYVATLQIPLVSYARAWQWRCIHKNADCQLKTVHALQR